MTLMGIREYARHRGVSQASVTDAINSGRISDAVKFIGKNKTKKKIECEKADQLWDENTILNNKNHDLFANKEEKSKSSNTQGNLAQAKSVREAFAAKTEKLKYERMAGKLIDADEVKKAAKEMGLTLRDAIQYLPDKLAPVLAAETDIEKVNEILSDELESALNAMSNGNFQFLEDDGEEE